MLKARRHVQDKDTHRKFLHGSRCQIAEEKSVARLAYKEFFKGSIKSNMDLTLGQIHKDETHNVINHDTRRPLPCKFLRAQRR
jgi:hypothetical protein